MGGWIVYALFFSVLYQSQKMTVEGWILDTRAGTGGCQILRGGGGGGGVMWVSVVVLFSVVALFRRPSDDLYHGAS